MSDLVLSALADTERLGRAIAAGLRRGEAVCLFGPLGAGKSTLARALIRALTSSDEEAPSPTFTLVQSYDGRGFRIAHFDLYRLRGPDDVVELGLDEAIEEGAVLIEWPERLDGRLPPDRLEVVLSYLGEGLDAGRLARLGRHGAWTQRDLDF